MTIRIPQQLKEQVRCIRLRMNGKEAIDVGWADDKNYPHNHPLIETHRGNIGIMPIGNLMVIDCDGRELYDYLPDGWKDTLVCASGREGGFHVYLLCDNAPPGRKFVLEKDDGTPLGDLRTRESRFYTVAGGSIHPNGKLYHYLDDSKEIASVNWIDVEEHIVGVFSKKVFAPKLPPRQFTGRNFADRIGLRITDVITIPANAVRQANGDYRFANPVHGSENGFNFSVNPDSGKWYCYRCGVGGDVISWISFAHCGAQEGRTAFKDAVAWLRNNGFRRQITEDDDRFHAND